VVNWLRGELCFDKGLTPCFGQQLPLPSRQPSPNLINQRLHINLAEISDMKGHAKVFFGKMEIFLGKTWIKASATHGKHLMG
jgi:hypothetical protein